MTFSVIVPTYNRVALLRNALESIFRQDSSDFEVIVVNDGSTDATDTYLSSIAEEKRIVYLKHENQGLAATRSAGLEAAKGDYIAFTDDDCTVPPNWLSQLRAIFENQKAVCIGGNCITGNPENPFAEANDLMQSYFKQIASNMGIPFFTGNNVAYTREVLKKAGGPDKRFRMGAEDRDLLYRVAQTGGTIVYAPEIAVHHFNDSRFMKFIRHQFEFGEGSYLFYHYTASRKARPTAFPLSVYLGVFVSPFRGHAFGRALQLFFLILLAQTAVTAGYVVQRLRYLFPKSQEAAK